MTPQEQQHKELFCSALRHFARTVRRKLSPPTTGEPEAQLRSPFENLMEEAGDALEQTIRCTDEHTDADGRVRPDYAIDSNGLLTGIAELKTPGKGADPEDFSGHDRVQWGKLQLTPNLLYTDGNEWALYRTGERVRPPVRLSGDIAEVGEEAVAADDAEDLLDLLTDFLSWNPIIPDRIEDLCEQLAPLCAILRRDVTEALTDADSPLTRLAADWRGLLFPDASDEEFADAYAQTVTFALLLARSEGADVASMHEAEDTLQAEHSLLSRALEVLTDPRAEAEIRGGLHLLQRYINAIPEDMLSREEDPDPWLYFYEDFLAAYDPDLRKNAGAYYTPREVVHAQVRLVDELLRERLGRNLGFADDDVVTLDPGVGTGTYLLGVVEHALERVKDEEGEGSVDGKATSLAANLYGFENMVGPYAVSQLRLTRALENRGAELPDEGPHIYLTDTLESPNASPPDAGLFYEPISEQHAAALEVKASEPVLVCIGNPPYDRHGAADDVGKGRAGGWVRWGEGDGNLPYGDGTGAILNDFLQPALDAGHSLHVKNLYNLYVYFWRWALWKVFEHQSSEGAGVVSFISASSYLDGDAFAGMREHIRRVCDEFWVLDLGGEGRGTRQSDNVFDIQTPVAVAVAVSDGETDRDQPAAVHYARVHGDRDGKLGALEDIHDFADVDWDDCPDDWQAPLRPAGEGAYFDWVQVTDLFPWQQSGVKVGRTWVIAPDQNTLQERWREFCSAPQDEKRELFKDSPSGRKVDDTPYGMPPLMKTDRGDDVPPVVRYAYRSFDRQFLLKDRRLLDRGAPTLWRVYDEQQVFLTSLFTKPLGTGPALIATSHVPDLDHFSGRGGKDVVPLYRDKKAERPNIAPGFLQEVSGRLDMVVTAEDVGAYVYGVLAHPAYTKRFRDELESREVRVPLTERPELFRDACEVGRELLWLHTYGERFVPDGWNEGELPHGEAQCTESVPPDAENYPEGYDYNPDTGTLCVGEGRFEPVAPEVYEFEVSGLKVVQSWLDYRMKEGAGRKSSPLDDIRPERWPGRFTTELLELLWVLEATLERYPRQKELLEDVLDGPLFTAEELPDVPDEARKAPRKNRGTNLFAGQ